jgi:hypothetical protein
MILALTLLAAQSVQDMTLQDGLNSSVNVNGRSASYCDDFNRANGGLGASWATGSGSYAISGNEVAGTGTLAYVDNSVANCAVSSTVASVQFGDNPGGALVYVALRCGVGGGNNFFVKIQDQSGTPSYNTYGFYINNNSNPGGYGIFGTLPLTCLWGRIDVSYDAGTDRMRMDVDEFDDGSVEQTVYSGAGASAYALAGTGYGVGTYGSITFDNFDINSGCGGPPAFTLAKTGTCPGPVTLTTTNGTASGAVAIVYGNSGSFTKPSGTCAGITLGISSPNLGAILGANGAGSASISFNSQAGWCGRTVQAVDISTCTASNTITL